MDALLPLALRRQHDLAALFTDQVTLEQAPDAYRRFASRQDGCIKVGILPL